MSNKTKKVIQFEICPNPVALSFNTNWNIQLHPALEIIISSIEGVEEIIGWGLHKYNFLVIIGACFSREEIIEKIEEKIDSYFSENE